MVVEKRKWEVTITRVVTEISFVTRTYYKGTIPSIVAYVTLLWYRFTVVESTVRVSWRTLLKFKFTGQVPCDINNIFSPPSEHQKASRVYHKANERHSKVAPKEVARKWNIHWRIWCLYIKPGSDPTCDGMVILIIKWLDGGCGMETFTIQATLLGRNISRAFAELFNWSLPNGCLLMLSNQVYKAPDGVSYGAVGIPPRILLDADILSLNWSLSLGGWGWL